MGQSQIFLYCNEHQFENDANADGGEQQFGHYDENVETNCNIFPEQALVDDDFELVVLKSKEKREAHAVFDENIDGLLIGVRKEVVEWMIKVNCHYGFCAGTCVLAVDYFDRFLSSSLFQKDKPWMCQLVAVACLSLAAKVEETCVPLLIDLQVEECKYVFEARTIKRMELLVLSTLEWKMNPVTPVSYFDHIVRRLGLNTNLHREFMGRCECLLLSVISDARMVCYSPSVLAAATVFSVILDIEPCNSLEYQNQLMDALKISEDNIIDCYKLILDLSISNDHIQNRCYKRKHSSIPNSPNGVIDMSFSSDSSNDSWSFTSSITSSSPYQPLFKKSRAQDQLMRLPPLNKMVSHR